ncbi:MAG: DUF4231 domain-containing protein [Calditrichaeota bacterium]|nr:DUF4231 domain-containing protein [Calditrichota bacterium]
MAKKSRYLDWMKSEMTTIIEKLDLDESQNRFMRSRWLDQVLWMEGKAAKSQRPYYALRLIVIIGGIIVPALVSLQFDPSIQIIIRWITFGLSLCVAISAAVEGFFNYGKRWQHYRSTVELLKSEGWQFFQMSGNYRNYDSHSKAYPEFAERVENILRQDVQVYIRDIAKEKEDKSKGVQGTVGI